MDNLELKLKIGQAELELKGSSNKVVEMYNILKDDLFKSSTNNFAPALYEVNHSEEEILESEKELQDIQTSRKTKINKGKKTSDAKKKSNKPSLVQLDDNFNEEKFYNEFSALSLKTMKEKIFMSIYLYNQQTSLTEFTPDLVHTLLDKVAIDTPETLKQMLTNYVNQDKLMERVGDGFKLKHIGMKYCQDLMTNNASTE